MTQQTAPHALLDSTPVRRADRVGRVPAEANDNRAFLLTVVLGVLSMYAVTLALAARF